MPACSPFAILIAGVALSGCLGRDAGRGSVVGFASGVHYVHPDKPAELWINEVGVAPSHQRRGLGKRLLHAIFARGRELGCREAWVLTSHANGPAVRLYEAAGGVDMADPPVMFTFRLADTKE